MKFILKIIVLSLLIAGFLSSFNLDRVQPSAEIKNKTKTILKNSAKKLKQLIYKKAAKTNPPGDILPDEIDDKLIHKIKEIK
ncbi:MAG: hypothetical protein ABIC19_03560 [Patescibacteria group bacterium]|nr:hypothetical protein [Patescibacteria group bacterium]